MTRVLRTIAATSVCIIATCVFVHAETISYRVDRDATNVEYAARAFGIVTQRGRFADVRGSIVIDRDGERGSIELVIDARSIDSGWNLRDAFLRGTSMLDASRHPAIRFQSQRLSFESGTLQRVDGALTLRGVTRPVTLTIQRLACRDGERDAHCDAHATASIRRSDFGMESYAPLLGDDVELDFFVAARRSREP